MNMVDVFQNFISTNRTCWIW